ncbi:MAG: hypothetical protein FJY18_08815, partial [Bacteroidetes bacterium]|nr:hypothetical protein [Bacteroidota bacterium]
MQYVGIRLPSTALAGTQPTAQINGNLISINTATITLPQIDTVLLYLMFVASGNPSYLIWDRATQISPSRIWEPIHGAVNPVGALLPTTNGNQTACTYGSVDFRLTGAGSGPFQWFRLSSDGNQAQVLLQSSSISGVNTSELSVQALLSTDSGRAYFCRIGTTGSYSISRPQSLRVYPFSEFSFSDTLCLPGSYSFGGFQTIIPGTYYDLLQGSSGCDSLVTLHLSVLQSVTIQQSVSICENQEYNVGPQTFQQSGSYTINLRRQNGCDSTILLNLTVLDSVVTRLQATICPTDSLWFHNQWIRSAGIYTRQLTRTNGCDSLVILNLQHLLVSATTLSASICQNDSFLFAEMYRFQAGIYSTVLTNIYGCDSLVSLQLTVHPLPVSTLTRSGNTVICPGDSSTFIVSHSIGRWVDWYRNDTLISGATG